jgi:hypothetical protein
MHRTLIVFPKHQLDKLKPQTAYMTSSTHAQEKKKIKNKKRRQAQCTKVLPLPFTLVCVNEKA